MNFSFYTVNSRYCDYLRKTDPCVPYTMDRKSVRPFVGIVVEIHDFCYYAPLTSPKPKELSRNNFSYCLSFSPIVPLKNQLHSPLCA